MDGASTTNMVASGGVFKNNQDDFLGDFAEQVGYNSAFFAEVFIALRAIELAHHPHYTNLWLGTNLNLTAIAFKNQALVTWCLRNRWSHCLAFARHMNLIVTNIYREDNVVNSLTNVGFSLNCLHFLSIMPSFLRINIIKNKLGYLAFGQSSL